MPDISSLGFAATSTSLFTPEEVEKLMRIEFERAQRYNYAVACLVITVDRLEQIHTVHGFESKAEVLGRVYELVRDATRAGDLLAYQAEDRLICVFPHTSARAARGLTERLLRTAGELIFQVGGASLRVTLSVGLAHNEHSEDVGFDTLRRVALEGLAVAEAAGGDRWSETELYSLYEAQHRREAAGSDEVRVEIERLVGQDGNLEQAVAELADDLMQRAMREARNELEQELRDVPAPAAQEPAGEDFDDKEASYQREIELLQRRVSKLTDSLGLTEQELTRIRKVKGADDGVSSVYRDVQGLSMDDACSELKEQLMTSIFEANLDLLRKRNAG